MGAIRLTEVEYHMKYSGRHIRLNADRLGAPKKKGAPFFYI